MLRDVYWRQYPVDLLSDDKMACVEAMLPDEQKHIPYMVYIAALKLCDDHGVFDLDDGVVMARLTRVKDVSIICHVINLMRQRKILYRLFDNSNLCGLVDWTYADKKPRTIEERRRLVAERIKQEQNRTGVDQDFTISRQAPAAPVTQAAPKTAPEAYTQPGPIQPQQEAQTAPEAGAFSCPENDKKVENVVKTADDDKNAKNVVTVQTIQDNTVQPTVQTNIQDSINTHTQQQFAGSGQIESPTPANCQDTNAVGVKNIQDQNTNTANINTGGDANAGEAISSLAEMALQEANGNVEKNDTAVLKDYLNEFFVKNCYGGYDKSKSAGAINTLAGKILELSDDVNPPETVAGLLCSEFKKMCDGQREKYWNRMPLLPANMIKSRAWAELVQYAGKILATNANSEKFMQAAKKAQEECQEEKELIGDAVRAEYLKYNINPENPDAHRLLLMAKSREAEEARKAEDEDFEIF